MLPLRNQGSIPEREHEKRLPHPRKAAGAVIPAPIAYIKVVAVKKLVVGSRVQACGPAHAWTRDPTTSFLTATTLIYAIGAGITAAAGTRLALQ